MILSQHFRGGGGGGGGVVFCVWSCYLEFTPYTHQKEPLTKLEKTKTTTTENVSFHKTPFVVLSVDEREGGMEVERLWGCRSGGIVQNKYFTYCFTASLKCIIVLS